MLPTQGAGLVSKPFLPIRESNVVGGATDLRKRSRALRAVSAARVKLFVQVLSRERSGPLAWQVLWPLSSPACARGLR